MGVRREQGKANTSEYLIRVSPLLTVILPSSSLHLPLPGHHPLTLLVRLASLARSLEPSSLRMQVRGQSLVLASRTESPNEERNRLRDRVNEVAGSTKRRGGGSEQGRTSMLTKITYDKTRIVLCPERAV
eukprot:762734-Hanusia_phi.AAC.4